MKYVVTGVAGMLCGAAGYELSERLQWTRPHQRALMWAIAIAVSAFVSASLWP